MKASELILLVVVIHYSFEGEVFLNNAMPNKSLHRSAKQLLSYQRCVLNFMVRVAGFALGELRRSALSWFFMKVSISRKYFFVLASLIALQFCAFYQANAQKKVDDNLPADERKLRDELEQD